VSTRTLKIGACLALLGASAAGAQRDDCLTANDPAGDAVLRRTDHGNDGTIHPAQLLPDVVRAEFCGWQPDDPEDDPYTGETIDADEAHIFRLRVVFAGLINPPGPIGLDGDFDPFRHGNSPLVGFLDVDLDDDDTGGELGPSAETRYLANVARFARVPHDDIGARIARSRDDLDNDFYTPPQYERSGADFALVFCGCFSPDVLELDGDGDARFESDESWLVTGRFFERSRGYQDASAAYNGSEPGLYDPVLDVLFEHSSAAGETTVTLVWALDAIGAAALAGESIQNIDLNVANHTCVQEALQDIIDGADDGGIFGPPWELVRRWAGEEAWDHLDVSQWREITGLFGAPYSQVEPTLYAWTDTMGEERFADLNGDEYVNTLDEQLVRTAIYGADGGAGDADGTRNGVVVIPDPGWNFSLYDTDGNMRLDLYDQEPYGPLADFDGSGVVNTQDFIAYLNAWAAKLTSADFNLDQKVDTIDFIAFLNEWVAG